MFKYLNVLIGDTKSSTISAKQAWGLIIAKKYKNDLIKDIKGIRDIAEIELNGGDHVDYDLFSRTFNRRFK